MSLSWCDTPETTSLRFIGPGSRRGYTYYDAGLPVRELVDAITEEDIVDQSRGQKKKKEEDVHTTSW